MAMVPYRIITSLASHSITKFPRFSTYSRLSISSTRPSPTPDETAIVTSVCRTLHQDQRNWDSLTKSLSSIDFTDLITQNTLLNLREPVNAKKALNFFHWSARQNKIQHGIQTYCIMIHILVKARLIKDSKALLKSVIMRIYENQGKISVFTVLGELIDSYRAADSIPLVFDLFMQSCIKLRLIDDVLKACKVLNENCFYLSLVSYNTMLYVIQKSDKTSLVWGVYEHLIEQRKYPNESTVKIMVEALCKEGRLQMFVDILERITGKRCSSPLVIVNTCLVYEMVEEGRVGDGLVLLKQMLQKNMILDVVGYSLVVFSKVKMGDLEAAWEVYEGMLNRGFDGNSFVYTLFIGAYSEEGKIEEAIEVFEEMENSGHKPYDETFNMLMRGCSRIGRFEQCLKYCKRMVEMGLVPSCLAFNEMVEKLCDNGYTKQVDELITVLLDNGFVPNENTYSYLVAGYGKEGNVEDALKLYYEMEYKVLSPSSLALSSLIVALCQHKRLSEAKKFLLILKNQSLLPMSFIYESMIASYLDEGDKLRAQVLYHEMVENK